MLHAFALRRFITVASATAAAAAAALAARFAILAKGRSVLLAVLRLRRKLFATL
jgi:hypothetical protein